MVDHPTEKRKIFKNLLRILVSFFAGLAGGLLLFLVVGYLIDIASYPFMKNVGNRALRKLRADQATDAENAWEYYTRALDKITHRPPSSGLKKYANGDTLLLTDALEKELASDQDIFNLIRDGNELPGCSFPVDFQKGWKMILPGNNDRFKDLVALTIARSKAQLDRGQTGPALGTIFTGLSLVGHLTAGVPQLSNYTVGIVLFQRQLAVLRSGLREGRFKKGELPKIEDFMTDLESGFPSYRWVMEGEININRVGFANIPFYLPVEVGVLTGGRTWAKKYIGNIILLRYKLWRYGFSTRLAVIRALKLWEKIVDELDKQEKRYLDKTWPLGSDSLAKIELRLPSYAQRNPMINVTVPLLSGFFRIKTEMLTRIRMLNLACRLWSYREERGRFPTNLSEIIGYTTIEPFTGETWGYRTAGDSAVISSPGFNKVYGDVNDLTLTLKK